MLFKLALVGITLVTSIFAYELQDVVSFDKTGDKEQSIVHVDEHIIETPNLSELKSTRNFLLTSTCSFYCYGKYVGYCPWRCQLCRIYVCGSSTIIGG